MGKATETKAAKAEYSDKTTWTAANLTAIMMSSFEFEIFTLSGNFCFSSHKNYFWNGKPRADNNIFASSWEEAVRFKVI
jgi:hypothetical protein